MSLNAKSAVCPKDQGFALAFGRSAFKCRKCGHEFTATRGNKYNAQKSEMAGATFESNLERRFLQALILRQKAGEVSNIRWKPRIEVDTGIFYKPEATYFDKALGTDITVDTKGSATKGGRFPTICTLWRNHRDHPLHVVEQDSRSGLWKTTRKILPRRKDPSP